MICVVDFGIVENGVIMEDVDMFESFVDVCDESFDFFFIG